LSGFALSGGRMHSPKSSQTSHFSLRAFLALSQEALRN
jgi:hypothetical protein